MKIQKIIGKVVFVVLVGPFIAVIGILGWPAGLAIWSALVVGNEQNDDAGIRVAVAIVAGSVLTVLWWYCLYRFGVPIWVRLGDM